MLCRSLLIADELLHTKTIFVIHHTDCGGQYAVKKHDLLEKRVSAPLASTRVFKAQCQTPNEASECLRTVSLCAILCPPHAHGEDQASRRGRLAAVLYLGSIAAGVNANKSNENRSDEI